MIYALIGTDARKREKALAAVRKLGTPSVHVYGEQVGSIEPLIDASSLFGDAVVAHLIQTLDRAESREHVYRLLPAMKDSPNIFILDEPFADANRMKKLEKFSAALYDAREEKQAEASPFSLCSAFARRDKKASWTEWLKVRDAVEAEAVQGALWWKFQSVWSDARAGKQASFTLPECERFGKMILTSSILAHRGEKDLKVELERVILSI